MKLPWQKQEPEPELLTDLTKLGQIRSKSTKPSFIDQFKTMMTRNSILQLRYYKSTLAQAFLAPIIFTLLLFILQNADYGRQSKSIPHPSSYPLLPVAPCQGTSDLDDKCITIGFTPNIPPFDSYMAAFGKKNAERLGESADKWGISNTPASLDMTLNSRQNIIGFPSADFIYDFSLSRPNLTKWAVHFALDSKPLDSATPSHNIQYQVWYNHTLIANGSDVYSFELLGMIRGIDEAILSTVNDPTVTTSSNIDVLLKDWPLVPNSKLSDSVVEGLGPAFFFCSEMVIFISILNQIVNEKETKLKIAMEMAGLKPSVFWLSNFFSSFLLVFINALVTTIFGYIFQFKAFTETNFGVLLVLFMLFGQGMVSLAFFITCFIQRTRIAILVGIFIFIIGLLFESFVFSGSFVGYIWWDPPSIPEAVWKVLILLPFFNFGRMFLDIGALTTGKLDILTQVYTPGPGFSWSSLYENLPNSTLPLYSSRYPELYPPVFSYYYLLMNIFLYLVLAWYLDQVLPNEFGKSNSIFFFFYPQWWGFKRNSVVDNKAWLKYHNGGRRGWKPLMIDGTQDQAVLEEKQQALNPDYWPAIKVVNLRKSFRKSIFYKSKTDKHAVKDSCMTFQEGSLLALLGQNGAGKSTTMNILAGLTPATSGDALMYGYTVSNQMYLINEMMGNCPQHDILFSDLTAVEHIKLYAGLKGVPEKDWPMLIEDRLKCVRLWQVRHARAATYSGGMKRRLSLVISTIGDPKIIFMDEPTTGMDPVNRRHVWSFVEKFKEGRVIVLTTHSMEEADVLGDRIAIMAHGTLRAIGNSITLKSQYGAGYRINIITEVKFSESIKAQVIAKVPGVVVEDESAGALIFQFPASSTPYIPDFVKWLEGEEKGEGSTGNKHPEGVITWGISQSSLEEVFLKIIRDANPNGYSGYEAAKAAEGAEQLEHVKAE